MATHCSDPKSQSVHVECYCGVLVVTAGFRHGAAIYFLNLHFLVAC